MLKQLTGRGARAATAQNEKECETEKVNIAIRW